MLKLNRRAEVALDFINPQLGKIGPDTQDIREIADRDGRHGDGLAELSSSGRVYRYSGVSPGGEPANLAHYAPVTTPDWTAPLNGVLVWVPPRPVSPGCSR